VIRVVATVLKGVHVISIPMLAIIPDAMKK
jgi:hypothetical protein